MRQRSPTRIVNPVLPLREHLQPRVEVKLNIMSRGNAKNEEWDFDCEDCRSNRCERFPPKTVKFRRIACVRSRVRAAQNVLFQLRDSTSRSEDRLLQFNSELTRLKPSLSWKALPYSHWGGTDHEGLRDPHQRRGSGSSILRKIPQPKPLGPRSTLRQPCRPARLVLSHVSSATLPAPGGFPRARVVRRWSFVIGLCKSTDSHGKQVALLCS